MDNSIDIKTILQEILARPIKLPYQMTPEEVVSLMGDREILLKIAIKLEEQIQYLINKIDTPDSLKEVPVLKPVKKKDDRSIK